MKAKRIFDIVLSILMLILASPVLLVFSLVLLFEIRSFPIYVQERGLTLSKRRFKIFKLRTIRPRKKDIEHKTEADIFLKPGLKTEVTPFSKWLRKTGLDELPQLLNVILGQMSLVGPRPLMIEDLETMKRVSPELYARRGLLTNLPGISGLWQLFGNRAEGVIGMIALESLYQKVSSPFLDLKLLVYTTTVVLQAKNSDSIFFSDKASSTRVKTVLGNSLSPKITLNMPEGIAKFIIEKVEKHEGKYTIQMPQSWWYPSELGKSKTDLTKNPTIINIKDQSEKSA